MRVIHDAAMAVILVILASCSYGTSPTTAKGQAIARVVLMNDSTNLFWGIKDVPGVVLDKKYFVINYNEQWKIPSWVAYQLTKEDLLGTVPRTDNFRVDTLLLPEARSKLSDYQGSGYDRGHNAPAADFRRSGEAMSATFLLSNISPQTPNLNRGIWQRLESEVRDLVNQEGKAWIVTGSICMSADSHLIAPANFIGNNCVVVPTHCFKAILWSRGDSVYGMYAFLMPNQTTTIPGKPKDYLLTVDRLESITHVDFFPKLDDSLENRLENIVPTIWPLETALASGSRNLISPPPSGISGKYIGNKNSKVFHRLTCSSLPYPKNRVYFDTRVEAIEAGYRPCKRCRP